MGERRISRKRQGNVLSSCVSPAYLNALEMLVLTGECSGLRKRVRVCICALVPNTNTTDARKYKHMLFVVVTQQPLI